MCPKAHFKSQLTSADCLCPALFSCFMQVIHGGENLLEVVDALDVAAAQQEAALAEEQAAEARAAARIAELEGDQLNIEEQFSSVQVCSASIDGYHSRKV